MNYLLDTNVCIFLLNGEEDGFRKGSSQVRIRFIEAKRRGARFVLSSVVIHELWYGVSKSLRLEANALRLSEFIASNFQMLDFSATDAKIAGQIRADLESRGKRIGEYDTLIAGQARSRNFVLVTANTREFERVDGLIIEDWTQ